MNREENCKFVTPFLKTWPRKHSLILLMFLRIDSSSPRSRVACDSTKPVIGTQTRPRFPVHPDEERSWQQGRGDGIQGVEGEEVQCLILWAVKWEEVGA